MVKPTTAPKRTEFYFKDPQGKVSYKKVRLDFPNGQQKKIWFEWEAKGEGTGFSKGAPPHRFLYNVDRLIKAPADECVFVVEGENKCDALGELGFLGVCNDSGAGKGKWNNEWATLFTRRTVVILPDNDAPGRQHANAVKQLLDPFVDNLAVLELPGLPAKGDIIDWLEDASNTKEKLWELANEALKQSMFNRRPGGAREGAEPALAGKLASEYQERRPRWFLKPWVPAEMLTLVVGVGGAGKSSFVAYLLSKAENSVLLPGYEEAFEVLTLPRLRQHGVNLKAVRVLHERAWRLPDDEEKLIHIVHSHGAELVCVDPISSYLPSDGNENDGAQVRNCLESFARVASRTGAAVVGVRHPGKNVANVMVGSREWRNVPRSIVELFVEPPPPAPPQHRFISIYRSSLGQEEPPTEFRLVGSKDEPVLFTLVGQMDERTLALRQAVPDENDRSKVQEAMEMLQGLLANGEMESVEVFNFGEKEKLSDHCLRRAAKRLSVVFRRVGKGREHKCLWGLPKERNE